MREDQARRAGRQRTDLKDKYGREVYAGDVVQWAGWSRYRYEVVWVPDSAEFHVRRIGGKGKSRSLHIVPSTEYEVIGNIYENPELVEAPK